MKIRALVTGMGGAAGISFLRAATAERPAAPGVGPLEVEVVAADMDAYAAGLYLVPEERRVLVPKAEEPGFVPSLLEACAKHGIDVLVPTVDAELLPLARSTAAFAAQGTRLLMPGATTLETCLDKLLLARTLARHIPVPRTEIFLETFAASGWSFPLVVKPRTGSGSRGVRVVRGPEELSRLPRGKEWLVQEYLSGAEYSVDVLADRQGRVLSEVPRERLKVDSGVAVAGRTILDEELQTLARKVCRVIGLEYVANVQFRKDGQGLPKLLEVNPRFPGTMPLTVAAGVDMPWLALLLALSLPVPSRVEPAEVAMVRTWQEHFVAPGAIRRLEVSTATSHPAPLAGVA